MKEFGYIVERQPDVSSSILFSRGKKLDSHEEMLYYIPIREGQAEVVKLVDTQRSGRCALTGIGVRVPSSAPRIRTTTSQAPCTAACDVLFIHFPDQFV